MDFTNLDKKLMSFLKLIEEKKNKRIEPSSLKISTHSAKAKIDTMINLGEFSKIICNNITNFKKLYYEFYGISYNDIYVNLIKKKKSRNFHNCCSIIVKANQSYINMKIFTNGSITMTGCKNIKSGKMALNILLKEIREYPEIILAETKKINYIDFTTTMINSDYKLGFKIDADILFDLLLNKYNLYVTYVPEKYQGVKISFLWNKNSNNKDGRCYCKLHCLSKKKKDRICLKVTVSIFKTGSVVITGSKSFKQTQDAYKRINEIIQENYKQIVKFSIEDYID